MSAGLRTGGCSDEEEAAAAAVPAPSSRCGVLRVGVWFDATWCEGVCRARGEDGVTGDAAE